MFEVGYFEVLQTTAKLPIHKNTRWGLNRKLQIATNSLQEYLGRNARELRITQAPDHVTEDVTAGDFEAEAN